MPLTMLVFLIALFVATCVLWLVRRGHLKLLTNVSETEFGEYFRTTFGIDAPIALAERKDISRLLGVPEAKLGPDTRLADLVSGPLDSTRIGLVDLEFDLDDLARKAGVAGPIKMPTTIADAVNLRLRLKTRS